jgi:hypothetical protein
MVADILTKALEPIAILRLHKVFFGHDSIVLVHTITNEAR